MHLSMLNRHKTGICMVYSTFVLARGGHLIVPAVKNVEFWPLHKNTRKLCVIFQKRARQLLFIHHQLSHLKHVTCIDLSPPFDVVMQIAQTTLLLKEEVAMWFKNLHGIENSAILLHVFGT